jgi:hypothetical protein
VYNANADGELRMMTPSTTDIICEPDELYDQAGTYSSALINVTSYVLEEEQLISPPRPLRSGMKEQRPVQGAATTTQSRMKETSRSRR